MSAPPIVLPRLRPYRTWPGALAVFLVVFLYLGGLMVWNDLAPVGPAPEPGRPIAVGQGLSYVPAPGWSLDEALIRVGRAHGLVKGAAGFSVSVAPWTGSLDEPLQRAQRHALDAAEPRYLISSRSFRTQGGLEGRVFDYAGKSIHGRHWVIVDAGRALVVDVELHAMPAGLRAVAGEGRAMLESLAWERGR